MRHQDLVELDYDDMLDFDLAEDNPEGFVEVQSTQYRWGNNIIKLIQLGHPNQWRDDEFDADKAALKAALSQGEAGEIVAWIWEEKKAGNVWIKMAGIDDPRDDPEANECPYMQVRNIRPLYTRPAPDGGRMPTRVIPESADPCERRNATPFKPTATEPSGDVVEAREILAQQFEADDMAPTAAIIRAGGDAHFPVGTFLAAFDRLAALTAGSDSVLEEQKPPYVLYREDILEEAARVAENFATGPKLNGRDFKQANRIAAAIRSLQQERPQANAPTQEKN